MLFKFCFPSQISGSHSSPALPSRGSFWSAPDPSEHGLGQSEKQLQLKPGSKLLPQESQKKAENWREIPGTGKWTQYTRIPQLDKELINQPSCFSHSSPSPLLEALRAWRNRGAVNQEHGVSGTREGSTYGRNAKKKKKSSVWAGIKTACFQGREILPLWAAAGGMRFVREHNSKVCQTLHQWETSGTTENSDSNFWGCNTAWEIGTPSPRQTTAPQEAELAAAFIPHWVTPDMHCSAAWCTGVLLRSLCFPVSGLEQISRKTQDSPLKCLHMTQSENRSYSLRTHQLPTGNEPLRLGAGHLTLHDMEGECLGWEWLNEQRTRLGGTSGVTATLPRCRCHRVINTFILIIFLVSFWKSCHKWGGWKAKELKKILWPVMAQGTVSDKLSDKQTIRP